MVELWGLLAALFNTPREGVARSRVARKPMTSVLFTLGRYAVAHPARVSELVLRGVFLLRRKVRVRITCRVRVRGRGQGLGGLTLNLNLDP